MNAQNTFASPDVGPRNDDSTIEPARAQQCWIENVGAVSRGDQDDSLVRLEAIHLDQQLIQCLLALVMTATETGSAMASDRIDLVNKDDAGGVLLTLHKQI